MSAPIVTHQPAGPEASAPPVLTAKARGWRWLWLVLAGLLAVGLGVLFFFNPAHHSFYPFCAFHRITGWQCPGCGGLRAAHHLLRGEVWTAFRFNQLVVLAVPVVLWFAVRRLVHSQRPGSFPARAQTRWVWIGLAVLIAFWIVRNLPLEMFQLPAE